MPVRFEGTTEYDDHFQWFPSRRIAEVYPRADRAGDASVMIGNVNEPALQHKRRPVSVSSSADKPVVLGGDPGPGQDDYVLLGDQSKFASSVQYRTRSSGDARTKSKESVAVTASEPVVSSMRSPPPAPRLNGHTQYKEKRKKERTVQGRRDDPRKNPVKLNTRGAGGVLAAEEALNGYSNGTAPPPRPVKPKQSASAPIVSSSHARPQPAPADGHDGGLPPRPKKSSMKQRDGAYAVAEAQAGIARSAQDAGADYAMKYRAGIAPPRSRGPKRMSEYDAQFKWREPVRSSPLLAAEQVVYQSSPSLVAPSKSKSIIKDSEYRRQFKAWPAPIAAAPEPSGPSTPTKKQKLQRSKSMEALSPDQRPAAGAYRQVPDDNKRLLKGSLNPLRPYFPHGKFKTYQSEYKMNFQAPNEFQYVHGAWRGANPPHVASGQSQEQISRSVEAPPSAPEETPATGTSWYSEVVELRKKASEYKKRALGTHFSREHLAQLYARQADLWDTVSQSSALSALSLESTKAKRVVEPAGVQSEPAMAHTAPAARQAWGEPPAAPSVVSQSTHRSSGTHTVVDDGDSVDGRTYTAVSAASTDEGRITTPQLRHHSHVGHWLKRHHLDRTTPAVGGALLTSPPKGSPKTSVASSPPPAAHRTQSAPLLAGQGTPPQRKQRTDFSSSPTYGLPTRDTHVMVDEEASVDRPLDFRYVQSPPRPDRIARKLDYQERHPELALPPTIREDGGDTYPVYSNAAAADDDDIVSLSARSVASSCSLASEVLERARSRRDEFWGKTRQK